MFYFQLHIVLIVGYTRKIPPWSIAPGEFPSIKFPSGKLPPVNSRLVKFPPGELPPGEFFDLIFLHGHET